MRSLSNRGFAQICLLISRLGRPTFWTGHRRVLPRQRSSNAGTRPAFDDHLLAADTVTLEVGHPWRENWNDEVAQTTYRVRWDCRGVVSVSRPPLPLAERKKRIRRPRPEFAWYKDRARFW